MRRTKILLVGGARPNFMKIAPVYEELKRYGRFNPILVHTGQHYDKEMSKVFFDDLRMPRPDIYLGVGSGSHAIQTSRIMVEFERICLAEEANLVMVVGDVNSTLACALVAAKLDIPVAHVEAGLRSFDQAMPEEINRKLTDHVSDYLFTTCVDANRNLVREGISKKKIFFVGNVMIDSMLHHIKHASDSDVLQKLGLKTRVGIRRYAVVTLHRPSNVDERTTLTKLLNVLNKIAKQLPVILPAHPRTVKQISKFRLHRYLDFGKKKSIPLAVPRDTEFCTRIEDSGKTRNSDKKQRVKVIFPLGYLDFLWLMKNAAIVLTDSGGIQEETTILGVPCVTIRDNTERPITIKQGTNILAGNTPKQILRITQSLLRRGKRRKRVPKYWDGKAAVRIGSVLNKSLLRT